MPPSLDVEWQLSTCDVPVDGKDLPSKHGPAGNQPTHMAHQSVRRGLWSYLDWPRHAAILEVEARVRTVDSGIKLKPEHNIRPMHDPMCGRIGILEHGVSPQGSHRQEQTQNCQLHENGMPSGASALQNFASRRGLNIRK